LYLVVDIYISFHIFLEDELNEANDIKLLFEAHGMSVAAWAREYGFPVGLVYRVLRGEAKCLRGTSHEIAVALKLKPAVNDDQREKLIPLGSGNPTPSKAKE
jgi:gp16 family phage-associated protein